MKAYETSATIEAPGDLRIVGVPFAPGTEVDVLISPKRKSAEEFFAAWKRVCADLRSLSTINDDEIQHEIDEHRAGR